MGSSASLFFAPHPPTPASLGDQHSCPRQPTGLQTINAPGHSPSQAVLLMEVVAVKAPSTTGITLAPSPCQPRFFLSFFFFLAWKTNQGFPASTGDAPNSERLLGDSVGVMTTFIERPRLLAVFQKETVPGGGAGGGHHIRLEPKAQRREKRGLETPSMRLTKHTPV